MASGTAASAMGSIIGPIEKDEGYDPNFSAAANIATAPTGLLIPPSNVMITFSLVSGGTSVAALFMAGYIPGILWGLACMVVIYFVAKKKGYRSTNKFTRKDQCFDPGDPLSAADRRYFYGYDAGLPDFYSDLPASVYRIRNEYDPLWYYDDL